MTTKLEDLQKEINAWGRRLQLLKERKALLGLTADLSLDIEIEDIEAKLEALQLELETLAEPTEAFPPVVTPGQGVKASWGEAPDAPFFVGRADELDRLARWVNQDRCRLVAILGLGGVGKTALAATLTRQLRPEFEYVIWRSLRNAPPLAEILADLIRFLSNSHDVALPGQPSQAISRLMDHLRAARCLVVLDNVETILQIGPTGRYLAGYEGYGELLRRVGESKHQSCLLLTSREKPSEIGHLAGDTSPVRAYQLRGLAAEAGQQVLEGKGLFGSSKAWAGLVERYSGNPLALNLVAEMIREVYDGQIEDFLLEDETIFGRISDVLGEQFARLSVIEQSLMFWLMIEREPVSREMLLADLIQPLPKRDLMVALRSLRRRSLIETSGPNFTLQNVVMEYMTDRFIEQVYGEMMAWQPGHSQHAPQFFAPLRAARAGGSMALFNSHALIKATAKDYVRETQIRLILRPLIDRLMAIFGAPGELEIQIKHILLRLQEETRQASPLQAKSGYAAGNILNLLCQIEIDLSGYDFSNLTVWQAFLRDVDLHRVNFAQAEITKSIFTETMPSVFFVAFSPDGEHIAMSDYAGEVHLWHVADRQKLFTYKGHTRQIHAVAFSPDGQTLVTGSDDTTIKLWSVQSGRCLKTLEGHNGWVRAVAFHPDGQSLASGSYDQTVKVWEIGSGACRATLQGHAGWVRSVTFNPEGSILASGSGDHTVKLWGMDSNTCLITLRGHDQPVFTVAFSPDGQRLATGSGDHTLKLWGLKEVTHSQHLTTLQGHSNEVYSVAFSPDGQTLASAGQDRTIKLWDIRAIHGYKCRATLRGHTSWVWAVAFSPDGQTLVSGSADQAVKLWDVQNIDAGECIATWQGRTDWIRSVAFNKQSNLLVSGSADKVLRLWDVLTATCLATFSGHIDQVHSVAFSPDGQTLASAGWDGLAKLWDAKSGQCLATLADHASTPWSVAFHPDGSMLATGSNDTTVKLWDVQSGQCLRTLAEHTAQVYAVAFSPDGRLLASGSFDSTVRLWDAATGQHIATLQGHAGEMIVTIAFSPDGKLLAGGNRDNTIRLWEVETQQYLTVLEGHTGWLYSVTFSPDGKLLASGSADNTVRLWDVAGYQSLKTLQGHNSWVHSVAFAPDGSMIASGSGDETIRLWDITTGETLKVLRAERPYEGMNISHVTGLSQAQKATLFALGAVESN